MSGRIRLAVLEDAGALARLDQICFSVPWSEQAFVQELSQNHLAAYLVAEDLDTGMILGYAGIWKIVDEGHITNVAVRPENRGKGLGLLLVTELIALAERDGAVRQTLEVRQSNEPAIRLYTKLGFQPAGIRRKYYEDNGEDAVIMWRESNIE